MKKSILHSIFLSILTVSILVSTSSFTINKRYCGESLIEASFFKDLQKCTSTGCDKNEQLSENSTEASPQKCCKETTDVVYGNENLTYEKVKAEKEKNVKQQLSVSPKVSPAFKAELVLQQVSPFIPHTSPLFPKSKLYRYYQVFLI